MDAIRELRQLIQEGECLLERDGRYYSAGNKLALKDMLERAGRALAGQGEVPFSRNREFLVPRPYEEVLAAKERYTMAPTYLEAGRVYGRYGLKEAIAWFREQDMRRGGRVSLEEKRSFVLAKCETFLKGVSYGNEIGECQKNCGEELLEKMKAVSATSADDKENLHLAERLAECLDALRKLRFSRVLRSEKEADSVFLLTADELEALQNKAANAHFAHGQYDRIREIADEISLEETRMAYEKMTQKDDYTLLNEHFTIWGDTGRVVNFVTPHGTISASLTFILPAGENETAGLGHVWIDGVEIESGAGPKVVISNPAEDGQGIFLCNQGPEEESRVLYDEGLKLQEDTGYTLFFKVKQDGKFKVGLLAVLEFFDARGKGIGKFTHTYNRKSYIPAGRKALSMQCNAIVSMLEGQQEYADKAKYDMLFFMNDFCQGAEYWLVYNCRPEGCDAYGAVQAGRIMCSVASTYSMIQKATVFTKAEKEQFYGMVDYLVRYCLDLRDRTELSTERVLRGTSNWQTDMCIGTAALMMVLPDFPHRKAWLYNAEAVLRGQLAVNLNPDSSWPESIRYHHAALDHFSTFATAWQKETGEDWMRTTRLLEMFTYLLHTITPPYLYFMNRIGTPPFGDHQLQDGREFHLYGLYLEKIASLDKALGDRLFKAWSLAGKPVKALGGEALALENLLYADETQYKTKTDNLLPLASTAAYPDSGITIFRNGCREGREHYMAVMSSPKPIAHGHLDQGSFILYHESIPVVMDTGIEGYFNTSTQWHLSSYSHACLQFAAKNREMAAPRSGFINLSAGTYSQERGWADVPKSSRILKTDIGGMKESITIEIANPEGKGIHIREIIFEKKTGIVTIYDRISGFEGKVLFSLPMVMKTAIVDGRTVRAGGYYDVDMEVRFTSALLELRLERGRTTPMFQSEEEVPMLWYIRAEAEAAQGFRVAICPFKR